MSLRKGKLVSCQEACAALGKRLLGTTIAHFPGLKFAWVHPEKHVLGQTPDWPEGAFVYVSEEHDLAWVDNYVTQLLVSS